jgi:hypothetical protein
MTMLMIARILSMDRPFCLGRGISDRTTAIERRGQEEEYKDNLPSKQSTSAKDRIVSDYLMYKQLKEYEEIRAVRAMTI